MSAVLMTLFAVSILGALGMACYGLRVLVGRWDQPHRFPPAPLPRPAPIQPAPPAPQPLAPPPVWVAPMGPAPAPLMIPQGVATPRPLVLPTAVPPVAHAAPMPPRPPTPRPPTPRAVPGTHAELAPRFARGSIPPDFSEELEPDTDPAILAPGLAPGPVRSERTVQHGARFSVVRSNRR